MKVKHIGRYQLISCKIWAFGLRISMTKIHMYLLFTVAIKYVMYICSSIGEDDIAYMTS